MVFGYEEQMDAFVRMQLTDLARTLSQIPSLQVDMEYASHYEEKDGGRIGISQFWSSYASEDKWEGQKSDVYLRAAGSVHYSDAQAIEDYLAKIKSMLLFHFAKQLFAIAEEHRLEQLILQHRPGMRHSLQHRVNLLSEFFSKKWRMLESQKDLGGVMLCFFYDSVRGKQPDEALGRFMMNKLKDNFLECMQRIKQLKEAKSTLEIAELSLSLISLTERIILQDTRLKPFDIKPSGYGRGPKEKETNSDHPTKTHDKSASLKNNDIEPLEQLDSTQLRDVEQEFPGWPVETNSTETSGLADHREREADGGIHSDQGRNTQYASETVSIVQGNAQSDGLQQSSVDESINKTRSGKKRNRELFVQVQSINEQAKAVWIGPRRADDEEKQRYAQLALDIAPYKRKLTETIEKTFIHKQDEARKNLMIGRLGRNFLDLYTEEQPKLFYKKRDQSRYLDASFLLLVDCSASMYDKMEETHKGIVLFHEALTTLQLHHEITGFWEDAAISGGDSFPNYFQTVVSFEQSLHPESGSAIPQLAPQQDNRDGFAIREMTKKLLQRNEQMRCMIVFSDGEPAAADYYDQGIVDTCEAVLEARKQGIEVIGIFLSSDGEVQESDRLLMRNIYGQSSVIVPHASELPQHLVPIMRKLLLKAVR